jgi:hypothetical protein
MPKFENYADAAAFQLSEWVAGRPWHNPWSPDGSYGERRRDGECCPDFSCCHGQVARREDRLRFIAASPDNRLKALSGFLCDLIEDKGIIVLGGSDHE